MSAGRTAPNLRPADHDDLGLRIDGRRPISIELVRAVEAVCDAAEDHHGPGLVRVDLTGAPSQSQPGRLTVGLVTKWERALRRLERLPLPTVSVARAECGGAALDVLLATDFRIAHPELRLLVAVGGEAPWPGMTVYRLAQQCGVAAIRSAVLLGTAIDARTALELHLVDELVEDGVSAFAAVARRACALPGKELAIRRQLMFDAGSTSFEDALGSHLAACDRTIRRALVDPVSADRASGDAVSADRSSGDPVSVDRSSGDPVAAEDPVSVRTPG